MNTEFACAEIVTLPSYFAASLPRRATRPLQWEGRLFPASFYWVGLVAVAAGLVLPSSHAVNEPVGVANGGGFPMLPMRSKARARAASADCVAAHQYSVERDEEMHTRAEAHIRM